MEIDRPAAELRGEELEHIATPVQARRRRQTAGIAHVLIKVPHNGLGGRDCGRLAGTLP
jgi:hypothetical protein